MSRVAKMLIALIMAFTASASHAKVVVVISGAGDAAMELALDGAGDHMADVAAHRCFSSTVSPANTSSSCRFETGARTEPLSLYGRIGRREYLDHMVLAYSGRTDDPDHGPPKPLS